MSDDESITDTRLERVGLRCRAGYGIILTPMLSMWRSKDGWGLYYHAGMGDGFSYYDERTDKEKSGPSKVADIPNWKAFVSLCQGLGVRLKEEPS